MWLSAYHCLIVPISSVGPSMRTASTSMMHRLVRPPSLLITAATTAISQLFTRRKQQIRSGNSLDPSTSPY